MTLGDELGGGEPGDPHRRRCSEQWRRRRGLERRLHDGPSLRLSALSVRLGVLRAEAPEGEAGDDRWRRGLDAVQDELGAALQELREVSRDIYPSLLDEAGLGPALRELVTVTGASVRVDAVGTRCGTAAEGAAYFAVAACLAAGPDEPRPDVDVRVRVEGDDLVLTLAGVDPARCGRVLDEAAPLGGTVEVTGAGAIVARFPCG